MSNSQKILVSPLDWGLGHATRLIPIIKGLKGDKELIIGVNKTTERLMKVHFPDAIFEEVPAYNIRNSITGRFVSYVKMSAQIRKAKRAEEKWVKDFVAQNKVDLIISDSRFGFRHPDIKSVMVTHQLSLQFPLIWKMPGRIAQGVNEKWLSAFDEIWVPDDEQHSLSGDLSVHSRIASRFIGIQSRFEKKKTSSPVDYPYILCILSGPDPQRSELEKIILHQAPLISQRMVIVRGKPEKGAQKVNCANALRYSHLETEELATYIQNADLVMSRSGYSSLMDYKTLGCKNLFLVPTPGQTEQIYLAKRMKEMGICDFAFQSKFNLAESLLSIDYFNGFNQA